MKKSVQKVGMGQLRSCHGQKTSAEELQDSQISEVVIKKAQAGDLPRKRTRRKKRCWKRISGQDSYMSSDRKIE